jgi:hypothetical protein
MRKEWGQWIELQENNNHNDVDGSFKEGRPGVGILV